MPKSVNQNIRDLLDCEHSFWTELIVCAELGELDLVECRVMGLV